MLKGVALSMAGKDPKNRDLYHLLRYADAKDPFTNKGHGIKKLRDGGREPEPWMLNESRLEGFLSKRFPRAKDHCQECQQQADGCFDATHCELRDYVGCECLSCRQFDCAAMWKHVIQMCFRMGATAETAAANWNLDHDYGAFWRESGGKSYTITATYVRRIIQQIDLAVKGLRLDGKPPTGRKRGRPRKTAKTLAK
jgi:hypothetical protein